MKVAVAGVAVAGNGDVVSGRQLRQARDDGWDGGDGLLRKAGLALKQVKQSGKAAIRLVGK
ncbi:MAG: hypothetical protein WC869_16345 [Phycisphaerae bacterium]|jgi:hypothetical protein